jgi:hypothetical protein
MGSWSVYCGISKIAITANQQCVLLPIKENESMEGYMPYLPATLPIFGTYNYYGGIEDIITDDNTQLIEEHFGITINEFCTYLVDGKNTYDREEAHTVRNKTKNLQELDKMRFMWIDRKVYDLMSTYVDTYDKGSLHFGNPEFMTELGFEFVTTDTNNQSYDPNRFKHLWKHGDKYFLTDNWTILNGTDKKATFIHYVNPKYGDDTALSTHITIPEHMTYIADKAEWQLWKYNNEYEKTENLWILGGSRYDNTHEELFNELLILKGETPIPPTYPTLISKYKRDHETFGDRIADLITVRHNLRPMSSTFEPYILYITPQCGEYQHHQILLEKFTEINKGYIDIDEDE